MRVNLLLHLLWPIRRSAALCTAPRVSGTEISLFFERPIRRLMRSGPRRTVQVQLQPSQAPLSALRAELHKLTVDEAQADALLQLSHGSRPISTDGQLEELLARTASLGVSPQLRVSPLDAAALPAAERPAASPTAVPSGPVQMVSFFKFHDAPLDEGRLPLLELAARSALAELSVLGTVYLAAEGVNAQLAVPLESVPALGARLGRIRELRGIEARLNLGERVAVGEGAGEVPPPFLKLSVKTRPQVLTDGLEAPLDWARAGRDVPPAEWDAALATPGAVLLDCRNAYESDAGRFAAAEPLGTDVFSRSWDVLRARLAEVPKGAPILTYCTGGIRCVKVNAYLEQELGFTNTRKLQDGIVGYLGHLRETPDAPSSWRGENFVFDKRETVEPPRAADDAGQIRSPPRAKPGPSDPHEARTIKNDL